MEAFIGSIWSFGFNFAPVGWAQCNGQTMPISQNDALFALIGTTYGGDGQVTFGLPNLQGRTPIGTGTGPGLPSYVIGQAAGTETVSLLTANLPAHNHPMLSVKVPVTSGAAGNGDPTSNLYAAPSTNIANAYAATSNAVMATNNSNTGPTGNSIPISILNPFLTVNFCICLQGIFPSRN